MNEIGKDRRLSDRQQLRIPQARPSEQVKEDQDMRVVLCALLAAVGLSHAGTSRQRTTNLRAG